jgi:hypothetical protein
MMPMPGLGRSCWKNLSNQTPTLMVGISVSTFIYDSNENQLLSRLSRGQQAIFPAVVSEVAPFIVDQLIFYQLDKVPSSCSFPSQCARSQFLAEQIASCHIWRQARWRGFVCFLKLCGSFPHSSPWRPLGQTSTACRW